MNWDGLLLVNKPAGVTSHTVVQKVKERLEVPKAGHLGTLDPIATGLFPVCLGKATRLAHFYMKADKTYVAAIRFGFFTTTDDREGEPEGPRTKVKFTSKELQSAIVKFTGERSQKPPAYSAKKIKGKKAYELARKGVDPDLPQQTIRIYEMRLLSFQDDTALVYISCSSGTYVRSLARELGTMLECGAHVHELERTRFGEFTLEQACSPLARTEDIMRSFTPIERMLAHFPAVVVSGDQSRRIASGSAIQLDSISLTTDWARVFSDNKSLLAFAQVESEAKIFRLLPKIVFA